MKKGFKKNAAEIFITEQGNAAADPEQAAPIPKGYRLVKENKSERMQLLVRPTVKAAIKAEAEAQGLSMNDLINNILEEYTERQGRQ